MVVINKAIGIDLGTTHSCVAVWQHDKVEIIPNDQGNRTMPSCVSFNEAQRLIGEEAKKQMPKNPTNTIFDVKRLIGRRFNDAKVQEDMKLWPFKVINGINDIPKIAVAYKGETKEFSAEEISSMVLIKLKEAAEAYLGETVTDAVITVPAFFDDSQRQATIDAGHVAGLNVLQIINEPTSAAIAYGLDMRADITRDMNVLIFDLGGGTFDVSLVTINVKGKITVKAVEGDTHLGGQDFDNAMVDHFVKQFHEKHKTNMSGNIKAVERLRQACEEAKRALSSSKEFTDKIDGLYQGIDFSVRITRAEFEDINKDFFSKCIKKVESCLADAKMNKKDVDEVVLVGGSTRIPKVQQMLKDFFNGKRLSMKMHANEAVASGAAVLAAKLSGESNEKLKILELLDVVPLSLNVSVADGSTYVIAKRNSSIPSKAQRKYVTSRDNQSTITFNVYQGERSRVIANDWLGKFTVEVPVARKGKSKVHVVFSVDVNGILKFYVDDAITTDIRKIIRITNDKKRLSKEEIEKMLKDAQVYKLHDEEYKKKVFAHTMLEQYIFEVQDKIKSIGSIANTKIHENDREKIENAIKNASQFLDVSKFADIITYTKTLKRLEKVCVPIIAKFMK